MAANEYQDLLALLDNSVAVTNGSVEIQSEAKLRNNIARLVENCIYTTGKPQALGRFLVRRIAQAYGAYPASINDLYMARGRGEVPPTFTVPAINLRALSFDAARAVFRAAKPLDAAAFIFEIARSEMGYTDQRPVEYVTNVLGAAIAEGYQGPVFIQGDHFQVSAKRYGSDPDTELQALRDLINEAIAAGFYNIDIDSSTLVDLSQANVPAQQKVNTSLTAMFTAYIRSLQPDGITISTGGEIGEVGGQNSTEEELRAFMDGFNAELAKLDPHAVGISKISIQTGTSHGGVVLPDGTIKEVSVDFDTLLHLSRVARKDYGLGGAVQHGASTLPESAFHKFVEAEAVEVHLATNFQNMMFDRLPDVLRSEMYAYLDKKYASDRKPGVTDEQFYYKQRKNAIGPFKIQTWQMGETERESIGNDWEQQFSKLFHLLGLEGTRKFVDQTIKRTVIEPQRKDYTGEAAVGEEVGDLAD